MIFLSLSEYDINLKKKIEKWGTAISWDGEDESQVK